MPVKGLFSAEGLVSDSSGTYRGWVTSEDGTVTGMGRGCCPMDPDVTGFILADTLNMHTHCADYGLRIPEGLSLEELVAPPNGLKHRYLREAPANEIEASMRRFAGDSLSCGAASFVDFREGGLDGCRMLRRNAPDAVILGRPVSPELDPEEILAILDVADGIGISSLSDMDVPYIEGIADIVREKRMILAIHVSERIREDIDTVLSLDPAFVVHMCEATDDDIAKCAEAEVPIVVCPTSNAYFGKTCPAARIIANGADMAIGTDNGMLRSPDPLDEAKVLSSILKDRDDGAERSLDALAGASGKILNSVKAHRRFISKGPVAVLPSPNLEAAEALGNMDGKTVLYQKEKRGYGIQEHSGSHGWERIHQGGRP